MRTLKKIFFCALAFVAATAGKGYASESKAKAPPPPSTTGTLNRERVEHIYIGFNLLTTLTFKTKKDIQKVSLGSNIVQVDYDAELQQIELRAKVEEGATNMNVIIEGQVYRFIIHVVQDPRRFFSRTYSVDEEESSEILGASANSHPLRPDQIDVVRLTQTIERARMDPQFKKTISNIFTVAMDKTYAWNSSPVTLHEVTYFPEIDTLVFRIEFFNRTDRALYLHAKQYRIMVGGKEFPATVRTQLISTVFPGQMDKTYLFVQGYKIDPRNNWELVLPPEADSVRAILGSR